MTLSSLQKQGLVIPGIRHRKRKMTKSLSSYRQHGVWVPAFAGTTTCFSSVITP